MKTLVQDKALETQSGGVYFGTAVVGLLSLVASVWGLVDPELMYTREEFVQSFTPNDVVNLAVGLPILVGSAWAARRGSLSGLLFWPGALLYMIYNYLAYLLTIPLSWGYLLHLLILVVSLFTLAGLVGGIDGALVR